MRSERPRVVHNRVRRGPVVHRSWTAPPLHVRDPAGWSHDDDDGGKRAGAKGEIADQHVVAGAHGVGALAQVLRGHALQEHRGGLLGAHAVRHRNHPVGGDDDAAWLWSTGDPGRLFGAMMGLDNGWAKNAIKASGNYGEIFAANIGEQTPIGLPRGLNALWTQGGLMYAMPFR